MQKDGILHKTESRYGSEPWTITSVHTNGTIRVESGSKSEGLNIRRVTPFLNKIKFKSLRSTKSLMLVVSNRTLSTHANATPTRRLFFLTEVFFPIHADSSFVGASDMSTEIHCKL